AADDGASNLCLLCSSGSLRLALVVLRRGAGRHPRECKHNGRDNEYECFHVHQPSTSSARRTGTDPRSYSILRAVSRLSGSASARELDHNVPSIARVSTAPNDKPKSVFLKRSLPVLACKLPRTIYRRGLRHALRTERRGHLAEVFATPSCVPD